jgi:membrane-associated phospholipid phosphatase
MPPIDPPGHASYPSGHATESYLISRVLTQVMPVAAAVPLQRLADRIARNREVLGMHYRSDSEAGRTLAEQTFPLLSGCASVVTLIKDAKKEWAPRN